MSYRLSNGHLVEPTVHYVGDGCDGGHEDDLPFSDRDAIEFTVGEPPEVDPVQEAILAELD